MILSEAMLEHALQKYAEVFYARERPHQGVDIGNRLLDPPPEDRPRAVTGTILTRSRLGGLLRLYHRRAA